MEKIIDKKQCCGCTACMTICPKDAISFKQDNEGFYMPTIEQEKCVNCGQCKRICPVLNTQVNDSINKCYVGYNKNSKERINASSGSIFSLLANYVLENRGIVVGAAFDEKNHLKHIAIENKCDLEPLRKSKYLQSDLTNIFKYIKEQSKMRKVLFVGTPCQVAGIKSIIKDNNNLITIDLVCHGVPSPRLFEKYIKELEITNNEKIIDYDFRDKSTGWDTYSNKVTFQKKEIMESHDKNNYMKLFLSDNALRESCYNCNFKYGNKYSDITLGDFWGVKVYYPEMYNKQGVSAIIINTELGLNIFRKICKNIEYKECRIDEITSGNYSLCNSAQRPNSRSKFFSDIDSLSIEQLCKKYKKKNKSINKLLYRIKKKLKIAK